MNTEPNLENIISRLNQLEKKNKRLRFLNFAILLVFASTVIIGWQSTSQFFKVIETEKLVIKNSDGKIMGFFGVDERPDPNEKDLKIYDFKLKMDFGEISIGHDPNFGLIKIMPYRISMQNDYKHEDIDIKKEVEITTSSNEYFGITVTKENKVDGNQQRATIRSNNINIGDGVKVKNASIWHYKPHVEIKTDDDYSSIKIYDKKYFLRAVLGSTSINYSNGNTVQVPESSIWLFNENGNSVFNAPQ